MHEQFDNWCMYDRDGNLAVQQMMGEIKQALSDRPLPKVRLLLHERIHQVAERHGEIYDTEVRYCITLRLTRWACEVHELSQDFALTEHYWNF